MHDVSNPARYTEAHAMRLKNTKLPGKHHYWKAKRKLVRAYTRQAAPPDVRARKTMMRRNSIEAAKKFSTAQRDAIVENMAQTLEGYMYERKLRIVDLFNEMDTDGDRKLDPDELQDALQICGLNLTEGELAVIFMAGDEDHDGTIELDELEAHVRRIRSQRQSGGRKTQRERALTRRGQLHADVEQAVAAHSSKNLSPRPPVTLAPAAATVPRLARRTSIGAGLPLPVTEPMPSATKKPTRPVYELYHKKGAKAHRPNRQHFSRATALPAVQATMPSRVGAWAAATVYGHGPGIGHKKRVEFWQRGQDAYQEYMLLRSGISMNTANMAHAAAQHHQDEDDEAMP
jgi:Ca2+-binding EF-hand superfamily protein